MLAADLFFPFDAPEEAKESFQETVEDYLRCLINQGQVLGKYILAWTDNALRATLYLAAADALALEHHSQWAQSSILKLKEMGAWPRVQLLDQSPRRTSWQEAGSLFLFTHMFNFSDGVRAGDDGTSIPLYCLPITDLLKQGIRFWSHNYKNYDSLAIGCRVLEIPAYKQLADCNSELSQEGREHCREIETACNLPTYYYLHRYWGRRQGEAERLCPGCGGQWHKTATGGRGLGWFDFLCEPCRLVSHTGDTCDDERHARIGEWRPR